MTLSMVEGSGSRFDRFDGLTALRPSKGRLTAPRKIEGKTAGRRAKNRSFDLAQDRLSGGVLRRYVGATLLRAGKFPRPIKRHFYKRLLEAGCWHMSFFP